MGECANGLRTERTGRNAANARARPPPPFNAASAHTQLGGAHVLGWDRARVLPAPRRGEISRAAHLFRRFELELPRRWDASLSARSPSPLPHEPRKTIASLAESPNLAGGAEPEVGWIPVKFIRVLVQVVLGDDEL